LGFCSILNRIEIVDQISNPIAAEIKPQKKQAYPSVLESLGEVRDNHRQLHEF
jgi:hypothetical protein